MPILLGKCFSRGKFHSVALSEDEFLSHQYIIGATGTGKSTLLAREIMQAFNSKVCCVVVDPHGDLAKDIIKSLDREMLENVCYLDPLLVRFSLNPLELPAYGSDEERWIMIERLIGNMISFFIRLYGKRYWGPSLNRLFQESLRALYQRDDSPTLAELYELLSERLSGFGDFYEEIKKLPKGRTDAVLNKLVPFVRNRLLHRIFCTKISNASPEKLLELGKLVVLRIPKGEISETNTLLLGATFLTKTWLFALSRENRFPVILAVDEFHTFAETEILENMLSEGRKYGVFLILAHQHTKQIPEKLLREVLSNTRIKIMFRVSGDEASMLARNLGRGEELVRTLISLPKGGAVLCVDSRVIEMSTIPPGAMRDENLDVVLKRMNGIFHVEEEVPEELVSGAEKEVIELIGAIWRVLREKDEAKVSDIFQEYRKINPSVKASHVSNLIDMAERTGFVRRRIVKQRRGRPKILVELTERSLEILGIRGAGTSVRVGGDVHRAMLMKFAEILEERGYSVIFPEQSGREEQPDLIALRGEEEIAVEIETFAAHPEQIVRNYEKNVRKGRKVIFVVPDESVGRRIRKILGERRNYEVEVFD